MIQRLVVAPYDFEVTNCDLKDERRFRDKTPYLGGAEKADEGIGPYLAQSVRSEAKSFRVIRVFSGQTF